MQPKHSAIVAGLTLALSFGAVAAPVTAVAEEPTPGVASDATDIDKGLYTQQSFSGVLRSVQGVSFVNVTDEMKYFTKYESHGNYNQGFSYGDGYNALGYYQFDRRWSLVPLMKQVYNYDSAKYSMLKDAIDRGGEISNANNPMYANGQLTELGRIAQDAFLGAYNTDPVEFSALQDAYAYNSYYAVTESWLKSALGIDITGRADCVKGMVWSITNMCGTYGCQDFFRWANLSNDMTDREFVTALSGSVVNNVAKKYPNQSKYHPGWRNRYSNELKDCLVYIAEDEKEAANKNEAADKKPEESEPPSTPDSSQAPEESQPPQKPDTDNNEGNGGETNGSATGTGNSNSGSTGNGSSKPSNGSSDSSAGGDSGTNTGSGSVTASGSDSSKDDSNKGTDAPVTPTNKKPSVSEVFGSTLGSLMAGPSGNSSSNKDNDGQNSVTKNDATQADSKDNKSEDTSEKPETDKGSGSEEKKDDSEEKGNKSGGGKNAGDGNDNAGDNKENTGDNKDVAGDSKDNNGGSNNDSGSGNGNAGNNGGIMPKTGDLIVMASLASASLATLGATSIVSGKRKLDQQKKAAGQNDSEE